MAKSRHRKDHKKKLQARKENIANNKRKMEKMKAEFINQLIEQERKKGMFDNMPEGPTVDGPLNSDGSVVEGPSI